MSVDPYTLCPCGSGKKLKFCCSDLVGEIEKIHRMIEGEQPRAALRHVEQTLASHPGRASLLDLKASLELSLGEMDSARETIKEFVKKNPESATAHACEAMYLSESGEPLAAVASLQRALALVEREMPLRVYEAMGAVGAGLLEAGHVLAAQAHLWLHAALAPKEDTRSREVLAALHRYSGLPLLLRDQIHFRDWPEDVAWKSEAQKATRLADDGKWQQAVEIVDRLGQQHGAHPALVFNRALLGGWLGDDRALVAGFHAFAQLDAPQDDAVEAEAIAQLLDSDQRESRLDSLLQVYEIKDMDALAAALQRSDRVRAFDLDPAAFAQSDQPRPRHTYVLLDRAMPESGASLTRDTAPRMSGILAIYGRQTDRAERLELTVDKGPNFDAAVAAVKEVAGEALGPMVEEKVVGSVSPTEQALNWRWHLPRDTPPDVRRRLVAEERRAAIVERWPTIQQPALGGKSPRDAASDSQLRIPLMAAVLILEQGGNTNRDAEAIVELRNELGLPQPPVLEPAEQNLNRLPLIRVPRLNASALSDDELTQLYFRSIMIGAQAALVRLAQEAVNRPSIAERIPSSDAYRRMISVEEEPQKALAMIDEARNRSREAGESTANWDLAELELHLTSGNLDEAKAALTRIEQEHRDDPEVAAALYQLLYQTGVIPDQMPLPGAEEELPAAVGSVEPTGGRIWTPDSERAPGGKSPLWTPS